MKSFLKNRSVAFSLAVKFSVLVAVIILFCSTAFVVFLNINVRQQQNDELMTSATKIIERLQFVSSLPPTPQPRQQPGFLNRPNALGNQNLPPRQDSLSYEDIPYYITFSVFRLESAQAFSKDEILFTNDPFLPKLAETDGKAIHYREKDFYIDGDLNILYYAQKVQTSRFGQVLVQTSLNMDQNTSHNFLLGIRRLALFSFLPLIFLSFGIVFLITKKTMQPVKKITQTAKKISSANLSETLPVTRTNDEIDTLAQTFNNLFARLKSDFDREKQFTSDVSHELKTPLAVILGHANLIRRWGKDNPEQLQKSLNFLITEVHSMEAIVENLLQISRLENSCVKIEKQNVNLEECAFRLVTDTKAWAPNTEFIIDESVKNQTLFVDKELFYQACTIIVSNSVKYFSPDEHSPISANQNDSFYAKDHLRIKLSFQKNTDSSVSFLISDNANGIAPEVLPHVFERFYRGDASHNRNKGGSGLGLSIVQSLMTALGGNAKVQSDGKTGTTIILTFTTTK